MKEIIIGGMNVAECCYYENQYDTGKWCDVTCTKENAPVFRCENIKYCYFKQLKRLEKENEELKTLFNDDYFQGLDMKTVIELAKKSIRVTAYNRELEDKLEKIKELCKEPNEPYYNSKCEYGIGRIDLGQEILEIIEEK